MAIYIKHTFSDNAERAANTPYSENGERCDTIYIPSVGCDDCGDYRVELNAVKDSLHSLDNAKADKSEVEALAQQVSRALTLLRNKRNTVIAMTDSNNNEVSVTVLAE